MKKAILIIFALLTTSILNAQIKTPVKWNITCGEIDNNNTITLTFKANIDDGWHIYGMEMPQEGPTPTSFNYTLKKGATPAGSTTANKKAKCGMDNLFGMELCEYSGTVTFQQKMKVSKENGYKIVGYVEYMACDNTNCLSPTKEEFTFQQNDEATSEPTDAIAPLQHEEADTWKPVIDQMSASDTTGQSTNSSLWLIFCLGMLGGILAILTPCVWPIIPMTVSFFLKKDGDAKSGRMSAILYGISIILIYVGLGVVLTLLFGANALNALSTSAIFNLFLFLLLILFAISFFGGFELTLPASWSTKIDSKAEETAGILGILLMALTLVVVSFSCTGPIVGTLLVEVSSGGNILAPTIGML